MGEKKSMKLQDFCQPFYNGSKKFGGIRGKGAQKDIPEFFMSIALGDMAKVELEYTDDQFRKWFKGEREPVADLWGKVVKYFDETRFSRAIAASLNTEMLSEVMRAFGVVLQEDEVADKYAFCTALASQFREIAIGSGEAENIMEFAYRDCLNVAEFPEYVRKSKGKYSKLKTLLYSSQERNFDDFFVCNTISTVYAPFRRVPSNKTIENVTLEKLAEKSRCTLLVGMGGIGKSMMMRHLFLTSIREYDKTGLIPILVTLREFGAENNDLFNVIVDSVHRFDITFSAAHVHRLMADGKCQLLLDGLDEIKPSDLNYFQLQLDALIDRYPGNQYVMSSRDFSEFVELTRFRTLWMLPFSNEQALELIDKLEYYPEQPKLKQQFREKLVNEYFETHAEFVTNPLLLTLMLMNFRRFSDVPEKKYLFYEQAYQTLLQRHDADKLAYKRVFQSVNDPSEFTWVFREFCAKSYRMGDYEFDEKTFETYFDRLKARDRVDPKLMTKDNFLFDVCHSACLMYEESRNYHFLHRSFQEYFFADYYARQDDTTLRRLGEYMAKSKPLYFDDGSAYDMLYDFDPEKVERFIFIPYLEKVFELEDHNKYWHFLKHAYGTWNYTILEDNVINAAKEKFAFFGPVRRYNGVGMTSLVYAMILRNQRFSSHMSLSKQDYSELGDKFKYSDLMRDNLYAERVEVLRRGLDPENEETENEVEMGVRMSTVMHIPNEIMNNPEAFRETGLADRLLLDEEGNPVVFGHTYSFDFALGIEAPEKYQAIVELWEKPTCPARKVFTRIEKYYNELKKKYEHAEEMDDDDF